MDSYLGIDPGAKGSLCLLVPDTGATLFLDIASSPDTLRRTIMALSESYTIKMAGIEQVHAIFGTSAGSNFTFGFNVGLIHGIVRTTGIGLDLVQPKVWQKSAQIPAKGSSSTTKFKATIAEAAQRLYPRAKLYGPKGGVLDGRADALLIAHHLVLKYHRN